MSQDELIPSSENPYVSPELAEGELCPSSALPRAGILGKFGEAVQLWYANFALFAAIILTVWLPGHVLVNYLLYSVDSEEQGLMVVTRSSMWIEAIFGPIYVAAMIHALWSLKHGQQPRYSEAIAAGFRNWGRLFAARFFAGFFVLLGFIALIIPGIVLSVRYALLDPAVVLEGAGTVEARERSAELTAGVRWQIFWTWLLYFIASSVLSVVIYLPLDLLPRLDNMASAIVLDCVLEVALGIIHIVMFLYYWEAVTDEGAPAEPSACSGSGEE